MPIVDLTPFGFTPTESLAYDALVRAGPLTGYGLARELSIARANAYQALRGLVAKGAASPLGGERPERYRPVQPSALLARLAEQRARELDRLEAALAQVPSSGATALVDLNGERALLDLALRMAARASGPLSCLAPASLLSALAPAWHKRASSGEQTMLWVLGGGDVRDQSAGFPVTGIVSLEQVERYFPAAPVFLVAAEAALVGLHETGGFRGHWTSHPALVGAVRAALAMLTGLSPASNR
jgi:sugar-specific transcriptional regulator TrmB